MGAATISNTKILYYGLQANYDAIATKDSSILYFCTDTKKIYKGDIEMTEQVIFAATKPATGIVSGKLYVIADTGTVEIYNGSTWTVVSYPIVKSTAGSGSGITVSSTDVEVPSAKAVYDYVQGIVGGDDVVTSVTASSTEGYIDVTNGSGTTTSVAVHGAVTTPSYTAATRTFTFPVVDGDDVVVELGKDIFIDPEANNRYENGNIYLYLNDGNEDAEQDPTELVIPVTALVTDYFGDDTDTVSVSIDNTTHKVTADVNIRPDVAGSFTNALKVSSATGAIGLYVDNSAIEADIATIKGDASTTGSIAYAVKELADGQVATNTAAIATLNGDNTTTGSVAYAIKQLADGQVDTNANNISVLAAAVEWGTF